MLRRLPYVIGTFLFKLLCGVGLMWVDMKRIGAGWLWWLSIAILAVAGGEMLGLLTGIIELNNQEGRVG